MIPEEYFVASWYCYFWDKHTLKLPQFYPRKQNDLRDEYSLEEVAESLSYYYKKSPKKIIFDHSAEGLVIEQLDNANKIVGILTDKYDIPINDILYVSGVPPIIENFEYYKQISLENNYRQFPIIFVNHYEYLVSEIIRKGYKFEVNNFFKPKKFVSFNSVPRVHRVILTALLIEKNLLDQSYYSININKDFDETQIKFCNSLSKDFYDKVTTIIKNNKHNFPMVLSKTHDNFDWFTKDDLFYFNNARFSVVQETPAFNLDNTELRHYFSKQLFFSEKTYRVIGLCSPFIMVNRPYTLKGLKASGYKTFTPFINESYDNIEDDEERIKAIANEIERLCNLTDEEWTEILKQLSPILEFNYKKLINSRQTFLQ